MKKISLLFALPALAGILMGCNSTGGHSGQTSSGQTSSGETTLISESTDASQELSSTTGEMSSSEIETSSEETLSSLESSEDLSSEESISEESTSEDLSSEDISSEESMSESIISSSEEPSSSYSSTDEQKQTYNFYIDYSHSDTPFHTMKWWAGVALGEVPAECQLTSADAPDEAYPVFLGWSKYSSAIDESQLWDFTKDASLNKTVSLYGVWVSE